MLLYKSTCFTVLRDFQSPDLLETFQIFFAIEMWEFVSKAVFRFFTVRIGSSARFYTRVEPAARK